MSDSQSKKRARFRMEPAPTAAPAAPPAFPSEDPESIAVRQAARSRLSREKFDALRRASRRVDHRSLQQAITTPDATAEDVAIQATLGETFLRNRHPLSSALISLTIHLAIFLTLVMIAISWPKKTTSTIAILAEISANPIAEKSPNVDDRPEIQIDLPDDNQSPIEDTFLDNAMSENVTSAATNDAIANVVNDHVSPVPNVPVNENARTPTLPTGGGMEGRDPSTRAKMAASRGGSQASETAVENGIRWLIAHQRADGSWRLRHDDGRCKGQCSHPGKMESTTAATGLALMALMGAGYTHRSGPYQDEIQKGLDYLREKMRLSKFGGSLAQGEKGMYSHAIATIALSEAFAMTQDTSLIQIVDEARKYIETAQHKKGGWRYIPGTAGDMTVTGWQLMALKSCDLANFPTPKTTWIRAETFVDSLASSSGNYGYLAPGETPTTTAVGVLSKMYLGASLENDTQEMGTRFIAAQGPSKTDVYFNYYAAQILIHRNDSAWPQWNQELRDYLIDSQDRGNNHQAGSWYFQDKHGQMGGRLYTTAMVIMTLEVYYRFMPLYEENVFN